MKNKNWKDFIKPDVWNRSFIEEIKAGKLNLPPNLEKNIAVYVTKPPKRLW